MKHYALYLAILLANLECQNVIAMGDGWTDTLGPLAEHSSFASNIRKSLWTESCPAIKRSVLDGWVGPIVVGVLGIATVYAVKKRVDARTAKRVGS